MIPWTADLATTPLYSTEADNFVNGGSGYDTLMIHQNSASLDFSNVSNIEKIDLDDDDVDQSVAISLNDVLNMTDADNVLQITGENTDTIHLTGSSGGWSYDEAISVDGNHYFTYAATGETVNILSLADGVNINVDFDDATTLDNGTSFDV